MSKNVLVIDDSELALEVIKDDLEDGGFYVDTVQTANEALKILASGEKPDIILLDVMMPGMEGGELCVVLKNATKTGNIPVILVSMKEEEELKQIVKDFGADGYIWKANVSPETLAEMIEKHSA